MSRPREIFAWRGREFLGREAVARAAGVSASTVGYHLQFHGHLERLGCGTGNHAGGAARRGRDRQSPVCGYPSIKAFADAAGLPVSTIYSWRSKGRHDRILAAAQLMTAQRGGAVTPSINIPN